MVCGVGTESLEQGGSSAFVLIARRCSSPTCHVPVHTYRAADALSQPTMMVRPALSHP
jgi:hypothetical protein